MGGNITIGEEKTYFSVHGFRNYSKTSAEQAGMKPINTEILMGHSTGISDFYYLSYGE
jgi:hypothetical protein